MNAPSCMEAIMPCQKAPALVANMYYKTEISNSIQQVHPQAWQTALAHTNNLFMQYAYLQAVEQSHQAQMSFRYALFTYGGQPIGAACFQLFTVNGYEALKNPDTNLPELVSNHVAPLSATTLTNKTKNNLKRFLQQQISKMRVTMLVCGNALLTADCGATFSPHCPPAKAFELLNDAINQIKQQEAEAGNAVQLTMVKDFLPHTAPNARQLLQYRYKELHFQPNMVLRLLPQWSCFDDYLQAMSSKYRVRTKRVLAKGKALQIKDLSAADITRLLPQIYDFYTQVAHSVDFNLFTATPHYFTALKEHLPDSFTCRGYFLNDQLLGFMCAFNSQQHLEVHFTGYNHQLNKEYAIYSSMLYDMVCLGLQQKAQTISFGRTALEIKSTIGAEPVNMPAFVKHSGFFMNRIIAPLINQFNQTDWTQRHPFKLEAE